MNKKRSITNPPKNNIMKTKKMGITALALLLVTTSCNQESIESPDGTGQPFSFQPVLGKQTKAVETTELLLRTLASSDATGFPVRGYVAGNSSTTPFLSKNLYYSGGWIYNTAVNHPNVPMNFYAWYPNSAAITTPPSGSGTVPPTLVYTVNAAAANQEDLIAATVTDNSSASVPLGFEHLLSQVNLAVQGMENIVIELSDLKVTALGVGTYSFASKQWSDQETETTYDYVGSYAENANAAYTPAAPYKTTGADNNLCVIGDGTNTKKNALMLIPQTFNASSTAKLAFNFKLKTLEDGLLANKTATIRLNDFFVTTWEKGKRYLYVIDFSNYRNELGPVAFAVTVGDWEPAGSSVNQTILISSALKPSMDAAIASHNIAKGITSTLTVFPICVSDNPGVIALDIPAVNNFVEDDQIRIELPTPGSVGNITLNTAGWTKSTDGRVVIFTKD